MNILICVHHSVIAYLGIILYRERETAHFVAPVSGKNLIDFVCVAQKHVAGRFFCEWSLGLNLGRGLKHISLLTPYLGKKDSIRLLFFRNELFSKST